MRMKRNFKVQLEWKVPLGYQDSFSLLISPDLAESTRSGFFSQNMVPTRLWLIQKPTSV